MGFSQNLNDTILIQEEKFNQSEPSYSFILDIESELKSLHRSILHVDSLLNTKVNQKSFNEEIKQINSKLSNVQKDINNKLIIIDNKFEKLDEELSSVHNSVQNNIKIISSKFDNKIKSIDKELSSRISQLDNNIKQNLEESKSSIDQIKGFINTNSDSLIATISSVKEETDTKISIIDKTIFYWIIVVIIVLILVIAVFFFLKSKMGEQIDSLSSIKNTQEKLEKNAIQLDEKLIKALEEKIKIETDISKDDHSLPLTLASEIHRMRKRLKIMDDSQGKKVLNKRIENLEDTLNEMGYEIIDLEGQKYNEGMSVQAQFIEDESLGENEKIITKVIKPQINYKDKLIQTAEVQVSQGV